MDDFGLDAMDPTESRDAYEILTERHRAGSIIVTSNRGPDEWLATFAAPSSMPLLGRDPRQRSLRREILQRARSIFNHAQRPNVALRRRRRHRLAIRTGL